MQKNLVSLFDDDKYELDLMDEFYFAFKLFEHAQLYGIDKKSDKIIDKIQKAA